jgi:B12-binding domain/radical SAM domain protein
LGYLSRTQAHKKKFGDRIIFIAGGPHPTGDPKGTLKIGFDYVLAGEGEEVINGFFEAILDNQDMSKVPGVCSYSKNGEYTFTKPRGQVDLDKFLPFSEKYRRFGPIEITRGCPFACAFCQTSRIFGCNIRHRSVAAIENCLRIFNRNSLKDFRAITPNAFAYGSPDGKQVNLPSIELLLKTIKNSIPHGRIFLGSFPSEMRPEHVTHDSMELLCSFADNDNIIMGAQTGSPKLLLNSHRGHTVDDIYRAVDISIKHGKIPNVDFIFGLPGEDINDVKETIVLMNELINMGAKIHAHTFMPLPQTPYANVGRGKVNDEIRAYIRTHINNGVVYGNWAEQARISKKIDQYFKTGKLNVDL